MSKLRYYQLIILLSPVVMAVLYFIFILVHGKLLCKECDEILKLYGGLFAELLETIGPRVIHGPDYGRVIESAVYFFIPLAFISLFLLKWFSAQMRVVWLFLFPWMLTALAIWRVAYLKGIYFIDFERFTLPAAYWFIHYIKHSEKLYVALFLPVPFWIVSFGFLWLGKYFKFIKD